MNYLDCVIVAQRRQAATHPLPQQRNWSPDPKGAKQRTGKQAKGGGPRHTPPHATCDTATPQERRRQVQRGRSRLSLGVDLAHVSGQAGEALGQGCRVGPISFRSGSAQGVLVLL